MLLLFFLCGGGLFKDMYSDKNRPILLIPDNIGIVLLNFSFPKIWRDRQKLQGVSLQRQWRDSL